MTPQFFSRVYGGLIVVFLLAGFAYSIAWPVYSTWSKHHAEQAEGQGGVEEEGDEEEAFRLELVANIRARLFEAFAVFWLFAFGASFGSFMNVVVYRLPRGRTLVGRSYCPRCDQAIHALDNIPVLGWLRLGGRCRTCRLPIVARYPLVELLAGVLFLTLAILEWGLGGVNLPLDPPGQGWGFIELTAAPDTRLLALLPYHAALVLLLLTAALIEYDGYRVPFSLFVFALAVGGLVVAFPTLHVQPWMEDFIFARTSWISRGMEFGVSLLAAFTLGFVIDAAASLLRRPIASPKTELTDAVETPHHRIDSSPSPLPYAGPKPPLRPNPPLTTVSVLPPLMIAGLFLGWRSLLWILAGAVLCRAAALIVQLAFPERRPLPSSADILGGAMLFLIAWRWLVELGDTIPDAVRIWAAPVAMALLAVAYLLLWRGTRMVIDRYAVQAA